MKRLTDLLNESREPLFENENMILEAGFLSKIAKLFGFNVDKVKKNLYKFKQDTKNAFATGEYIGAQAKDKEVKDAYTKQGKAAEKSPQEYLKALKYNCELLNKKVNAGDIKQVDYVFQQYKLLDSLANELKDNEGIKVANNLKTAIDKQWPSAEADYTKIADKVEKSGAAEFDNPGKGTEAAKEATIGDTEDEKAVVTKDQETEAVTQDIKDDKAFFTPLAQGAGVDGKTIRDAIVGLINKSLKTPVVDKEGITTYKWNADTKGFQSKNEPNLIKGLGAILCGLMMINHKGMNEKVTELLVDVGFSKSDYLKNLLAPDKK